MSASWRSAREGCWLVVIGAMASMSACAHRGAGVPAPQTERWLDVPAPLPAAGYEPAALMHVMRGQYYLALGLPGAAVPHLRLALIYARDSAYLHQRLAVAWEGADEPELARRTLRAGLAQHPDDSWLNTVAGAIDLAEGRWADAEAKLARGVGEVDTAKEAAPLWLDAIAWQGRSAAAVGLARTLLAQRGPELARPLASVLEDHGRLAEAAELYANARQQRPSDSGTTIDAVRVLGLLGRWSEAADALVGLFTYYPDAPELYVQLVQLLRRAGSPLAALYRDEALRQTSDDPAKRLLVALGDLRSGAIAEGRELLAGLLARYPDDVEVRLTLIEVVAQQQDLARCLALSTPLPLPTRLRALGQCRIAAGDPEGLFSEVFVPALAAGQGQGKDALFLLVRALAAEDDVHASQQRLEAALRRAGPAISEVDALLAHAQLLEGQGDLPAALALIDELARRRPEVLELAMRRADLLVRTGRVDEGLALMRAQLLDDPGDPFRLNALGFTLAELGRDLDEAEVLLRRAYRRLGAESFVTDSLGWVVFRRGDLASAERLLREAYALAPTDPEIALHLAEVLAARGAAEEARHVLESALRARPPRALRQQIELRLSGAA